VAMDGKFVTKPSVGWYSRVDAETGEVEDAKFREKDTLNEDFWSPIINDKFKEYLKSKFKI